MIIDHLWRRLLSKGDEAWALITFAEDCLVMVLKNGHWSLQYCGLWKTVEYCNGVEKWTLITPVEDCEIMMLKNDHW